MQGFVSAPWAATSTKNRRARGFVVSAKPAGRTNLASCDSLAGNRAAKAGDGRISPLAVRCGRHSAAKLGQRTPQHIEESATLLIVAAVALQLAPAFSFRFLRPSGGYGLFDPGQLIG